MLQAVGLKPGQSHLPHTLGLIHSRIHSFIPNLLLSLISIKQALENERDPKVKYSLLRKHSSNKWAGAILCAAYKNRMLLKCYQFLFFPLEVVYKMEEKTPINF